MAAAKMGGRRTNADAAELPQSRERRIAEMRRMLALLQPVSPASALRALREAFPEATLEERVHALSATRH
jgi:hypothetical protein